VSITTQNHAEFETLLDDAIAFDCDRYPERGSSTCWRRSVRAGFKSLAGSLFLEERR